MWKCEPKDCLYFEQLYLDYYEPWVKTGKGYNICRNAGNTYGIKHPHSQETKNKLSKFFSGENNPMFGVQRFEKDNPMWGKQHKQKSKDKIGMANQGKKRSKEFKENLREINRPKMRPVLRIDPKTGEIKKYECLMDVDKDGFHYQNVRLCCNKKISQSLGYYWKWDI